MSRSQKASVEKSRREREQSESCEKQNRVYRELRELRTQCTLSLIINSNKPILLIQLQINNHHLIRAPKLGSRSGYLKIGGSSGIPTYFIHLINV